MLHNLTLHCGIFGSTLSIGEHHPFEGFGVFIEAPPKVAPFSRYANNVQSKIKTLGMLQLIQMEIITNEIYITLHHTY
jgi:hypothetical protein